FEDSIWFGFVTFEEVISLVLLEVVEDSVLEIVLLSLDEVVEDSAFEVVLLSLDEVVKSSLLSAVTSELLISVVS
ncbi:hypothetical protein, partial [Enterococcus faecium]|uniref:hypothetical protein n=1 Tax=Enterococcus faecium TaxID=1352 RepID=UPI0039FD625A